MNFEDIRKDLTEFIDAPNTRCSLFGSFHLRTPTEVFELVLVSDISPGGVKSLGSTPMVKMRVR